MYDKMNNSRIAHPYLYFILVILFSSFFGLLFANTPINSTIYSNNNGFDQDQCKHILILNSYHQGYPWTDGIIKGILKTFQKEKINAEIHIGNLDTKRIVNPEFWRTALMHKLKSYPPDYLDLIIVSDDNALNTLYDIGHEYHRVPTVYCGISSDPEEMKKICSIFTGVREYLPIDSNIELGLKLFPNTKHIAIVTDNSPTGISHRKEAEKIIQEMDLQDIDIIWLDGTSGLTTLELVNRLKTLPEHSIVIFSIWQIGGNERYRKSQIYYPMFSEACNAPIFINTDVGLGSGFLGGKMSVSEIQGQLAAELGIRLLSGELLENVKPIDDKNEYYFDWKQLKHWGINKRMLPKEATIINRPLTIYRQYKGFFWITLGLILLLSIMFWVLFIYHFRYRHFAKQRNKLIQETKDLANRYHILFEKSNNAVMLFHFDSGNILEVNEKVCELFNYTTEELKARSLMDYFDNYEQMKKNAKELIAAPFEMELKRHDESTFYAQIIMNVLEEEDNTFVYAIIYDISVRKQQEKELILAKEKAEESDRLKLAFISNISHEIRTPLNGIIGFSNLLGRENLMPEDKRKYISFINENNDTLLKLINDILEISKIETDTVPDYPEACNLNELCQNIINKERVDLPITVDLQLADVTNINVQVDKTKLTQVLSNLISNAKKFTQEGKIIIGYGVKRDMIEFFIKDTGIGIPKDMHEIVFERFTQIDPYSKGTGLGLAISRAIVNKMGGKIWLQSQENKGTTFFFTFKYKKAKIDIHEIEPINKLKSGENTIDKKNRFKIVLIAEDNESDFVLLNVVLTGKYKIIRTTTGEETVAYYKKYHPDIILMDMKICKKKNYDAIRIIKKLSKNIPVIVLTSNALAEDHALIEKAGCDEYLSKPINIKLLLELLEGHLKKTVS